MARQPGLNNFAGTLEVLAGGPLDARCVVPAKTDLTTSGTFPYAYVGMIVSVEAEGKAYILTALDYTDADNWKEIGSGGSTITIDDAIDDTSENPVQNKVIASALDNKADLVEGKIPANQLPSFVDDVLSYNDLESFPEEGEDGKIYIAKDTNKTYRWSGADYAEISESLALGETSSTAYRGDRGKIAYDDSQANKNNIGDLTLLETEDKTDLVSAINEIAGGSGGSGSLGKAITAAIEVGGIDVGDEFAIGTSYDDMWDALLNPTLYPTFIAPSASLSYSADTYYEVGTSIAAKSATASLNRGSISPAYGTSGYRSGEATNYALATSGADTEYSDSSTSSGTFSVPALTRATKGNIVLTATVSYAAGEQPKDSKGNNYDSPLAAGSKTASKTMQFIQPYYYGKSATSTVSNFTGLTKSVTAKGQKQFKFTTNNEYMVIAYDSSYGNLSSIIDPNGFETISGWTKSTLTVGGFSYFVYVANSATTDTNAQFTFKY